jgi:hypothetical protein
MATPSKTQGTSLLSVQNVANNTVVDSGAVAVTTVYGGTVLIHIGRDVTTALTNPVNIRVLGSAKSSADDQWFTLAFLQSGIVAAISNTLSGSSNASGQNVLTATGNFTQSDGDLCFIKNGTIANSEFVRLQHVTAATTVSTFFNLTRTQTSATLYSKADEFAVQLDLTAIGRIRLVIDTLSTGQAVNVEAYLITCDSIA